MTETKEQVFGYHVRSKSWGKFCLCVQYEYAKLYKGKQCPYKGTAMIYSPFGIFTKLEDMPTKQKAELYKEFLGKKLNIVGEAVDTSKWSEEKRKAEIDSYRKSIDQYVDYIDNGRQWQEAKNHNDKLEKAAKRIENGEIIPPEVEDMDAIAQLLFEVAEFIVENQNDKRMVSIAVKYLKEMGFKCNKDLHKAEYEGSFSKGSVGTTRTYYLRFDKHGSELRRGRVSHSS
jgi:hypothetical protein